jgi:large subunit ribosomal protein LP1
LLTRQAETLGKVLKAAAITVEPYWPSLFAKALTGHDISKLLTAVQSSGPAPAAAGATVAAVVEKAPEEAAPEADMDMGGLFGDDDY